MARKRKEKVVVARQDVEVVRVIDSAELAVWRDRIAAWEDGVKADSQLIGDAFPIVDYVDRPFQVPPEIEAELRRRNSPEWREHRIRTAREYRREADHRRALAVMLREKGNEHGAATQDFEASRYDKLAYEAEAEVRI